MNGLFNELMSHFYPLIWVGYRGVKLTEAQISAAQFIEQALREGEMLVLTPRKARVFVES